MRKLFLNDLDVELTDFFNPENFTSKRKEATGDLHQVVSMDSGNYTWQKGEHKFVITNPTSRARLPDCYFVAYQGDGTAELEMGYEDYRMLPNCAMVILKSELDPAYTRRPITAFEVLKYFCMIATTEVLRNEWYSIGKYEGIKRIVLNRFALSIPEGRWATTEGEAYRPWFGLFSVAYFTKEYYLTDLDILYRENGYLIVYDTKNKTYQVLEKLRDGMLKLHPNDVEFNHVYHTLSDCTIRITNAGEFNIVSLMEDDIPAKAWIFKSTMNLEWLTMSNMFTSLDSISKFLDYHSVNK